MTAEHASRLRRLALPLLPRPPLVAFAAAIGGLVLIRVAPHAFYYVGATNEIPRGISPFEYVPALVGVIFVLTIPTGFDEWDHYGARHVAVTSVLLSVTALALASAVFVAGLALYPDDAQPPAGTLLPLLNNVVTITLIAVIAIGPLGRLLGTLAGTLAVAANYLAQASGHAAADWMPLTWYYRADLTFDRGVRWVWLAALGAAALTITWKRRYAPLVRLGNS